MLNSMENIDFNPEGTIVISFGKENEEISSAPFLVKTIEEMDNEIKFVVALPVSGEKGDINDTGNSVINDILSECVPIYPDEDNLYEIVFENYVFHMTRNESYTCWDDYEIRNGKYFIIFDQSRLMDCLPQLVTLGIVESYFPKGWKHYGIYCENHIIDVIAAGEPKIKKCIVENVK